MLTSEPCSPGCRVRSPVLTLHPAAINQKSRLPIVLRRCLVSLMSELPPTPPRRALPWRGFFVGLAGGILLLAGLWWWFSRPIQPVVLSPAEMAVVETKLSALQEAETTRTIPTPSGSPEPAYEAGKKEIVLTEREINGLLNHNTNLGKSLHFQLGTGVLLARFETDLDPDLPLLGGRRFKAKARFLITESSGRPSFVIDDLTIWGISLPNAWLGQIKGRNLLEELLGARQEDSLPGVQSFAIEPGKIIIRLKE